MKIQIRDTEDFSEVMIKNNDGISIYCYSFSDSPQAERKAFIQGFRCALHVANSAIQSIPTDYEILK